MKIERIKIKDEDIIFEEKFGKNDLSKRVPAVVIRQRWQLSLL